MKNIFILLICLTLVSCITKEIDEDIAKNNVQVSKTQKSIENSKRKPKFIFPKDENGNTYAREGDEEYYIFLTYKSDGTYLYKTYYNKEFNPVLRFEDVYDENGNVIDTKVIRMPTEEEGLLTKKQIENYSVKTIWVENEELENEKNKIPELQDIIYEKDENGNKYTIDAYKRQNGYFFIVRTFDKEDITKIKYLTYYNEQLEAELRYEHIYDENNRPVKLIKSTNSSTIIDCLLTKADFENYANKIKSE